MVQKEIYLLIISASVTFLVFCMIIIGFMILYQKRRAQYQKEIAKTTIEIKEQTLKNISWEIHDNVGQILSTLNLYSFKIHNAAPSALQPQVVELQNLIQTAITEVRNLSKALNTDYIKNVGLIRSTELELARFERLNFLEAKLKIEGTPFSISDEKELILLRIIQEFFSNSLKHARATKITVKFSFQGRELKINVRDNGVGFENNEVKGTGILNMRNRAKLIGAFITLESKINEGTQIEITYRKKNNEDVA